MNIRTICLTSLFCCSASFGMNNNNGTPIPPAKEGLAAVVGFMMKKCGLVDVCTDETEKVLNAFADLTNDPKQTIHDLMQVPLFQGLAKRTAEKDYLIDLELLEAMKVNNTAKIRALLERCKNKQSIKEVAVKFLEEENQANTVLVKKEANKQLPE